MKCSVCGTQLADNAKFCGVCGTVINQAPADISFQQKPRTAPNPPADINFQPKARPAAPADINFQPKARPAAPADVNFQQKARPAAPADVNFQQKARPAAPADVNFQPKARPAVPSFGAANNRQELNISFNAADSIKFISEDEQEIAKLSNSTVSNFLSGKGLSSDGAVLTNQRLYYNHKSGIINIRTQEEIVDVKDITGTKIANFNPLGILIFAAVALIGCIIGAIADGEGVLFLAGVIAAAVLVGVYFILKKSHLRVEYAGGFVYFSVKKYGKEQVLKFQKQIHIAKAELEAKNK